MEQLLGQILVIVVNIHTRVMNAEEEYVSMSTAVEHGLSGPNTNCNYFKGSLHVFNKRVSG